MDRYKVEILVSAQKELLSIPFPLRRQVNHAIVALQRDPRPGGWEALGGAGRARLRVFDSRILYRIDDAYRRVVVFAVRGPAPAVRP